jgi:predicted N-acetyltransferase YhbS
MSPDDSPELAIRPMQEADLPAAGRICRVAFGTFVGIPQPETFFGDADYCQTRFRSDPSASFVAVRNGEVVGSNFATGWGSVGFFGPLSVRPDLWNAGVAQRLLEPVMACFEAWGTRHVGLFTFAQSPKHVALYQKFGFQPRYLTAVMIAPVRPPGAVPPRDRVPVPPTFGELPPAARATALAECRELADQVHPGLDLTPEILSVQAQGLGDTLLLPDACGLGGFAVCHCGAGTEAGSGTCFVKFAAVLPGAGATQRFEGLLAACEAFAAERGLERLEVGANTART